MLQIRTWGIDGCFGGQSRKEISSIAIFNSHTSALREFWPRSWSDQGCVVKSGFSLLLHFLEGRGLPVMALTLMHGSGQRASMCIKSHATGPAGQSANRYKYRSRSP